MTRRIILTLVVTAVTLAVPCARAQLIIANPGVKSTDASKADLKEIFSGTATTLRDGSHVTPILLKAGPANDAFLLTYIGKSDAAFRASWRSLVFSGQATMPKSLDTEAAVVEYVARTPRAIGYISRNTPHEGVKVLITR